MMRDAPVVRDWIPGAMDPNNSRMRKLSLPELLARRQTLQVGQLGYPVQAASAGIKRRKDPMDALASLGAWNRKRIQNMILAVGPETPASVLALHPITSSSSSSSSSSASDNDMDLQENVQMDDSNPNVEPNGEDQAGEDPSSGPPRDSESQLRRRWTRQRPAEGGPSQSEGEDDEVSMEDQDQIFFGWDEDDGDSSHDDASEDTNLFADSATGLISTCAMRHRGCINTAAWLDCGWRISTIGTNHRDCVPSEDCPTQLVTSGDDHVVKFWDVRHAMGSCSPLPGGNGAHCPFSESVDIEKEELAQRWGRHYSKQRNGHHYGNIIPLASVRTDHHQNVFHVTPLRDKPGKVATCAADGYLMVTDIESSSSTVVVSPEFSERDEAMGLLHPGMCFSHHFISPNVGLLCSQRGLCRFDVRLPPREQPSKNLLEGTLRTCKACIPWSASPSTSALQEGDSAYVFAGGSGAEVVMCDLRMADCSSTVVQRYCPRGLRNAENVSVSGLDLSRDRQELLVSYESDQIYTFPVFPDSKTSGVPTIDEIRDIGEDNRVLPELAGYGGHLNRFTFLKNARYAGPQDEYICTGSDSGRAWIYEKATGTVVSLLNADSSTCNGVIPHPTLPFFITYGIESTAKLWRATTSVNPNVDDSAEGRRKFYHETAYSASPTVRSWGQVQRMLRIFEIDGNEEDMDVLPDQIVGVNCIGAMMRFLGHTVRDRSGETRHIGNDLSSLPEFLRKNYYICLHSIMEGAELPVESDIRSLKHRVSLMRLRHQADRLGIPWNSSLPWQLEDIPSPEGDSLDPADLIPDCPSDWIPYDPDMSTSPYDFDNFFNKKRYGDFYFERYSSKMIEPQAGTPDLLPQPPCKCDTPAPSSTTGSAVTEIASDSIIVSASEEGNLSDAPASSADAMEDDKDDAADEDDEEGPTAESNLYKTILLLKNAGNQALQDGLLDLAASRYDKAIQYGAVACMSFPTKNLGFAEGRFTFSQASGGFHHLSWTPLVKVLIACRLNLALLLLKDHFDDKKVALQQVQLAIHDLGPFCHTKGKIMRGKKLKHVYRENEPSETYLEAMALKAKAFFRLGSVESAMGDYQDAVASFELSITASEKAGLQPDPLVSKRLHEAKRKSRKKLERQRKKFKFAFAKEEAKAQASEDASI